MSKDKNSNFDSTVKGKLSPGYKTDVYSKLDRLLFNKNVEFYGDVQDKYIRLAVTSFLEDLNFQRKTSEGRYIYISVEEGIFKFIDEKPDVRVYDLPMDWSAFTLKISTCVEDNPIEKKEVSVMSTSDEIQNIQEQLGIEQEVRIYLVDEDNNRYYKGYTEIDGIETPIIAIDNEIKVDLSTDQLGKMDGEEFDITTIGKIYDKPLDSDDKVEVRIYNSNVDGLLKTKMEIEIEGLKDVLDEKGFATLSDGRTVVTDKEKASKAFKEEEEEIQQEREEYKEMVGYEVGDFLFSIGDASNLGTGQDYFFVIQPKSYWDNEKCQYDQHTECLVRIPNGLYEVMESTFEFEGTVEDKIDQLVKIGFKFQDDFQDFIDDQNVVRVNNGMTVRQYVDTL